MAAARNETTWQQGFVLSSESAAELGLIPTDNPDDMIVVMISHDCDLIDGSDPNCELIVGQIIQDPDVHGAFTNAKHPRRLHLTFTGGELPISAEFLSTERRSHDKAAVLRHAPAERVRLTATEHFTLQAWLASRYFRPVFPDSFNERLSAKPARVDKRISDAIKASGTDIVAVLFSVDDGKMTERDAPEDTYALRILVVYSVTDDPARALTRAKDAANRIKQAFRQTFQKPGGTWENIELAACMPVSEDVLTIYEMRKTKPWDGHYLDVVMGGGSRT